MPIILKPAMDDYIRRNKSNKQRIDVISGEDCLARNFTKLKLGRIDATIDDGMVISNFLKRTGQPVCGNYAKMAN